jgi:6-phosphogluconolactonase
MSVELEVVEDPARACAAMLLGPVLGGGHVVVTGGSTPGAAYEELASALGAAGELADPATIWFSDERCVGPDDELSNYGLLKRTLLDRLGGVAGVDDGVAGFDAMRIEGERGPEEAADRYEAALREAGRPQFDIVLLGLGPDGHIASMFPDQESLGERSRWVVGVPEAGLEPFVPRVTLTLPAITSARQIVFLVTGSGKADAVAAAFGEGARPDPHVPASLVAPKADQVRVLMDAEAAARL